MLEENINVLPAMDENQEDEREDGLEAADAAWLNAVRKSGDNGYGELYDVSGKRILLGRWPCSRKSTGRPDGTVDFYFCELHRQ